MPTLTAILFLIFAPTVAFSFIIKEESENMYENHELSSDDLFLNKTFQKIIYFIALFLDLFKYFLILT